MSRNGPRKGGGSPHRPTDRRSPDTPRAIAKSLLREAGMALEQDQRERGRELLEQALDADPSFVEPALALSAHLAAAAEGAAALRAAEEGVKRGKAMIDRLPRKPGGPAWWLDEATRPFMKARVAHATRLGELGRFDEAGREFEAVLALDPEDPLGAGALAAESWARKGEWERALKLYARLPEGPAVAYGRVLALLETGAPEPALVALWAAVLVDAFVAVELLGEEALSGLDRAHLVGDLGEAREYAVRARDLWTEPALGVLEGLLGDTRVRDDLMAWAALARELDATEDDAASEAVLARMEAILAPERIEAEVRELRRRLLGEDGGSNGRGRLPVLR